MQYYACINKVNEAENIVNAAKAALTKSSTNLSWWKLFQLVGFIDYNDSKHYLKWGSAEFVGLQYGDHGMVTGVRRPSRTFVKKVLEMLMKEASDEAKFIKNNAPYWGVDRMLQDIDIASIYMDAIKSI